MVIAQEMNQLQYMINAVKNEVLTPTFTTMTKKQLKIDTAVLHPASAENGSVIITAC